MVPGHTTLENRPWHRDTGRAERGVLTQPRTCQQIKDTHQHARIGRKGSCAEWSWTLRRSCQWKLGAEDPRWEVYKTQKMSDTVSSLKQCSDQEQSGLKLEEVGRAPELPCCWVRDRSAYHPPKSLETEELPGQFASGIDTNCPVCLPPSRCTGSDSSCRGVERCWSWGQSTESYALPPTAGLGPPPGLPL